MMNQPFRSNVVLMACLIGSNNDDANSTIPWPTYLAEAQHRSHDLP